jgi:hypothetical protein
MKNNTKLIMETWRRFMKEGPQDEEFDINEPFDFTGDYSDGELPQKNEPPFDHSEPVSDDFDRETQGPDSYVPDTGIVNAIVSKLKVEPHLTDEDIMEEVPEAYPEDIEKARRSFEAGEENQMTSGEENEYGEIYDPADVMDELY